MPRKVTQLIDWDAVKHDAPEFAKQLLRDTAGNPVILHDAQATILRGIQRNTAIVTGRQFGKTTDMAVDATWYACTHPHRVAMVVAPSLEQSKLIFNEVLGYFRKAPLAHLVDKIKEYPFPEIRLKNGTVLMARGANSPQFIRGNRVHRFYIDEAAYIKDSVITGTIAPAMTVTGKDVDSALILISTPFGRGAFYDYYQEGLRGATGHAHFHYTSYDNPYADRDYLESVKARYGENSLLWRTEYLGLFDTDDRAVFPWADIKWATEQWPFGEDWPIKPVDKHRYVQGVDLANMRDYFVASVVDDTDPLTCYLARLDRHQKKGYPFYKGLVRTNYAAYNHTRTLVDATSLGQSVAQDLSDISADGYSMGTAAQKWEIIQELARLLSEHRLLLPPRRDVIDELRFFEYDITPAKHITAQASQGHDDIVMSLALAAHLCAVPRRLGLMRSVPAGRLVPQVPPSGLLSHPRPAPSPAPTPGGPDDPWAALFREDADA